MQKACRVCCYVGPENYCPACRKAGHIRPMLTAAQLEARMARMRGEAGKIKAAIEKLKGCEHDLAETS